MKATSRFGHSLPAARETICTFSLISLALGMMTSSFECVRMAVVRHRIASTRPSEPSKRIQSPMRTVRSACSDNPAHSAPSTSCAEKAMAPVMTADVVTMPARLTPTTSSRTSA